MPYNYNSLRFGNQEEYTFPEVTYYDYTTNLKTRGDDDLSFRWQEVVIDSEYLLKEITNSGSFEDNIFTGSVTTTPTVVSNPYSYSGWLVTGLSAYHIGISGTYFASSNKWAYPIVNNNAILLDATGSDVQISYTGITIGNMPTDRQYQAYTVVRGLTGTTTIKLYAVAKVGGTPGAYYDYVNNVWAGTKPTGSFTVPATGYTEIKYRFYTSNITGVIHDNFDFILEKSSGVTNPVIIDELHLDEVLIRNPYIDYFIPTGYLIQITPDLGWHSVTDMFSSPTLKNPHLRTLGIYSISAGNLVDNLDGSVTANIDAEDFLNSTKNTYKKYYWRSIAVFPNGDLGKEGLPQRFEYVGRLSDSEFSIEQVDSDPFSLTKSIKGNRPLNSTILVNNTENLSVTYPTKNTWSFIYILDQEEVLLSFKARISTGASTSTKYLTLRNKTYDLVTRNIWNTLDEHGLLASIDRLPNESNDAFYNRIKDVYSSPASSNYFGLINGSNRELGLDKISNAITLTLNTTLFGGYKNTEAEVDITAYSIRLRNSSYITTETHLLDPVYSCCYLNKHPKNIVDVSFEDGTKINPANYALVTSEDESPSTHKLVLNKNYKPNTYITVTYTYFDELFFSTYPLLTDIVTRLNQTTDRSGATYLTAILHKRLSGGESSSGLFKDNLTVTAGTPITIGWSPIFINRISDREFRESNTSSSQQYYESNYYSKIKGLKNEIKIFWGSVECDRDYWGISESVTNSLDHIPTIMDPVKYNYVINNSGQLSKDEAWIRNYIGPSGETVTNRGLDPSYFQAGVGYINDLKPNIYIENTTNKQEKTTLPVSPIKNNNNYLYFTGQK